MLISESTMIGTYKCLTKVVASSLKLGGSLGAGVGEEDGHGCFEDTQAASDGV